MPGARVEVRLTSHLAEVAPAVEGLLGAVDAPADVIEALQLAVTEAVNNVIEHAYAGVPGQPIRLELQARPGCLRVGISDRGSPLPTPLLSPPEEPATAPAIEDLAEGGWGWLLIHETVDALEHRRADGWTHLWLEKRF